MGFNLQTIVEMAASPQESVTWRVQPVDRVAVDMADGPAFLLRRWENRVRKLHSDPKLFDQRLEDLGLSRATALDWLRPRQYPADRPLPSWAALLSDVLSSECFSGEPITREELLGPIRGLDGPDEVMPRKRPIFLDLARPFLNVAMKSWRAVPEFDRWLHADAVEDVLRMLLHRLSGLAARTLAYEVKQRSKAGELQGKTPQARYVDFMSRHVGTPHGLWRLFQQYPVLARLLAVRTEQTIAQVAEIVQRLDADAQELAAFSGIESLGQVAQLQLGLSDPHLGGRAVAKLKFASGYKLVYKPRSLAVDEAYNALVAWWNQLPGSPRLKSAAVLSRSDYGWAEHIATADCQSTDEVAESYRRQGAQTAIFYLLRGTDFHSENFIAHGAWPTPIDLECLFSAVHGQVPIVSENVPPCFRTGNLLFPTCMPPHFKSGEPGEICTVDSGIGGNAGRVKTQTVPCWSNLETDRLGLAMERRQELEQPPCLPRLNGQGIGPQAFIQPLLEGFRHGYDALVAHREQLLAPGGLLEAFRQLPTRCLMRSTAEYTFLLSWSTAPDQLTSGAAHDLAFEILVKYGAGVGSTLDWIDDEKLALWQRDVPFYVGKASSKRLTNASGQEVGPELARSSFDQVTALLNAASPEDCDWQCELLRGALQMSFEPEQPQPVPSSRTRQSAGDDPLLAEAIRLGDVLARQAIRDSRGATWLTLEWELHDQTAVALGPVRSGLYSGGAGIALFLANLAVAADEPQFATLAKEALRFASAQVTFTHSDWPGYRDRLAAFSSPYSQAYSLAECGRILTDEALIQQALACILDQNATPPVDNPDFINGAAGTICVLLHLYKLQKDDRLLTRALHLAKTIQRDLRTADGHAWMIPGAERPILGLGHGQVGIALAIDRLAKVADVPWASSAVQQAVSYEDGLFDAAVGDWPNRWYQEGEGHRMTGWCGGAPGHGLARLALLGGLADDKALRQGIERSLAAARRVTFPGPQNLCCGEPGRIWLLAAAGHALAQPALLAEARSAAQGLIHSRRDQGAWHLRPVTERDTLPTLMGGIAGIGLSLLAVRQPGVVSPLLVLG